MKPTPQVLEDDDEIMQEQPKTIKNFDYWSIRTGRLFLGF